MMYEQDSQAYSDRMEVIAAQYAPRALALLSDIGRVCEANGISVTVAPYDMSADDYRYSMVVTRTPDDPDNDDNKVDISIDIAEQVSYDGLSDYIPGINFGLDIVEYGGRILGGLTPYNYTEDCWVSISDDAAIADRWMILENADHSEIPDLIWREAEK
jgi:hypothetical protein